MLVITTQSHRCGGLPPQAELMPSLLAGCGRSHEARGSVGCADVSSADRGVCEKQSGIYEYRRRGSVEKRHTTRNCPIHCVHRKWRNHYWQSWAGGVSNRIVEGTNSDRLRRYLFLCRWWFHHDNEQWFWTPPRNGFYWKIYLSRNLRRDV